MRTVPLRSLGLAFALAPTALLAAVNAASAETPLTPAQTEFFEKRIRPVLVDKCYQCHSNESGKSKGGLLLDTRDGIREGGESGHAIVPGDKNQSLLLAAIKWEDKDMQMPPQKEGGKLPDSVIADFEKWVEMGAPDPRVSVSGKSASAKIDVEKGREFWAFQPPKVVPAPSVKAAAWPRTDVDRYVRAAQEAKGLQPVADADARTLVRRVYFDLIGLPPTPEQVEAFTQAAKRDSQAALGALVDRLLASPQFGERWGRYWLDVARYAESTGKERNFVFPEAWRYRDWVIAAVNADKPYDQFIREQIAGDLLPAKDAAERDAHTIATGFLALGPKGLNEKNREQFRMDLIDEQIDTTTRAVLGVTVACARCHDHKFDPIPQEDYYAVAGIFRSTQTLFGTSGTYGKGNNKNKNGTALVPLTASIAAPAPTVAPEEKREPVAKQAASARPDFPQLMRRLEERDPKKAARLRDLPPAQRRELMERYIAKLNLAGAGDVAAPKKKKGKKGQRTPEAAPATPGAPMAMGVREGSPTDARVLVRGEIEQPAQAVPRGFVQVMTCSVPPAVPPTASGRLELAQWLTSTSNPLTARVAVNRVWLHLFGDGLVRTPDNFGATGEKPTHPELLDALAVQFMRDGWSVKKLIRSLMLSRTYQLGSAADRTAMAVDPENRLFWRAAPRRLDAEALRDAMLTVSGRLDLSPAKGSAAGDTGDGYIGKGIRPERFTSYETTKRSVYLPVVRDFVPEVLDIFDFAEPSLVVAERDVTNVPAQALFLMNNAFVREQADAMARRILAAPISDVNRIAYAYALALGRAPTDAERLRADRYLRDSGDGITRVSVTAPATEDAWSAFCQALIASAEFRFLR